MSEIAPNLRLPLQAHEASASRFSAILESTTDLVMMSDCEGRALYLNKAGRRLLGWSENEPAERVHLSEIFPPWAYAVVSEHGIQEAFTNGSWSGETGLLSRDGREIPVLQVLLAHSDAEGKVEFYSTTCRDISERKQKELEQIEWSNRYDAAIRASGKVMFDWDSKTGAVEYAGAVEQVTGYTAQELDGGMEQLRGIVQISDRSRFDEALQTALDTRDPLRVEFGLKRKDGRVIQVKADGHFFLDRLGRIGRMVGFFSDITAEKIFERGVQMMQERLEQAVSERTTALEQANADLREGALQQEAVARLGQRALLGIPLPDLMMESVELVRSSLQVDFASLNELRADSQRLRPRATSGWPERADYGETPAGTLSQSGYTLNVERPVVSSDYDKETRFTPSLACINAGVSCGLTAPIIANGRAFGALGAFSMKKRAFGPEDISFLLGVTNILSAAIERLQVEQTAQLAQAEAEKANRGKSEFLSRMSHELRTPLNAILGFTQLLEMDKHDEQHAESIRYISQAGQNLLELINEVLDIAKIDSGRVEFHRESVQLMPLLAEVVDVTKSLAAKNSITILLVQPEDEEPVADTDRERLKQVCLNLLTNAIKYNRQGGSVTIETMKKCDRTWKVSVTDTGAGIAPDDIARLFVPFERLGQKEGGTAAGTGLGLALCHRLAKAIGGDIGVGSTVGIGSTFWIEVPAEIPEMKSARPEASDVK